MKTCHELIPVAYYLDGVSQIKRCDEHAFPWGVAPAYWYIVRPLYVWDHKMLGVSAEVVKDWKSVGLESLYWRETGWWTSSPKQYKTAAEALGDWNKQIV